MEGGKKLWRVAKVIFYIAVICAMVATGGYADESPNIISVALSILLFCMLIVGIVSAIANDPKRKNVHHDFSDWFVIGAYWIGGLGSLWIIASMFKSAFNH